MVPGHTNFISVCFWEALTCMGNFSAIIPKQQLHLLVKREVRKLMVIQNIVAQPRPNRSAGGIAHITCSNSYSCLASGRIVGTREHTFSFLFKIHPGRRRLGYLPILEFRSFFHIIILNSLVVSTIKIYSKPPISLNHPER